MRKLILLCALLLSVVACLACTTNQAAPSPASVTRTKLFNALTAEDAAQHFGKHYRDRRQVGGTLRVGQDEFGVKFTAGFGGPDFTLVRYVPTGEQVIEIEGAGIRKAYERDPSGNLSLVYIFSDVSQLSPRKIWQDRYMTWMSQIDAALSPPATKK